jgi:hypothetical protein
MSPIGGEIYYTHYNIFKIPFFLLICQYLQGDKICFHSNFLIDYMTSSYLER